MSDWDDWGTEAPKETPSRGKNTNRNSFRGGSLHVVQTVVAFLATAGVSFLVAWLSRDIEPRPMWLLACSFATPVLALMVSVLLVEKATSAMTPSFSRKAQAGVVAGSILFAALTGLLCQYTNTESTTETVITGWSDVVIVMDKSNSMDGENDTHAAQAVADLLDGMNDSTSVGFIAYSDEILSKVPIHALSSSQKQKILKAANQEPDGATNFAIAIDEANDMIANWASGNPITIIFVTDGVDLYDFTAEPYIQSLKDNQAALYYIRVGAESNAEVEKLVAATNGESIYINDTSKLLAEMQKATTVTNVVVEHKDALRSIGESPKAKLVVGILLFIQGLMNGIALTIMFSRQGQRRVQTVLSPVLAVVAFCILAFGQQILPTAWIREGIAFSLLGIVFMRRNSDSTPQPSPTPVSDDSW